MDWNAFNIVVGLACILALISLVKPMNPLLVVAVVILCIALIFVKGK